MTTPPNTWIKNVETVIKGSKALPMWGTFPSFPWKEFTKNFSEALGTKKFKMTAGAAEWKTGNAILDGMGKSPLHLCIELSPLKGNLSLVFPSEDFQTLSSWVIHPQAGGEGFADPYLQKGFFRYLAVEAMHVITQMQILRGLAPKIVELPLSKEEAYCIDIAIEKDQQTIWGRMICPLTLQESFNTHFTEEWSLDLHSGFYGDIMLDCNLTLGETSLSQEAWKGIREGDFIILDHFSYSPQTKKGTFQFNLQSTPLFQVKLKDENIKILDYAYYSEENIMEESLEEPALEEEVVAITEKSPEKMIAPTKVPIILTVEVAKLKMNLDKLLRIKPGNVLELSVKPEKEVSLVVNGQPVASGILIQVGDVLGVKISKVGQ